MEIKEALDLEFEDSDIGPTTIRGYMKELLQAIFDQGESFSGKRPFGNSGWEGNLAAPLIRAGWLEGKVDSDGYAYDYVDTEYSDIIAELVDAL